MLSFGLKIAWFTLSLSGLLSSWAVVPAFAQAVNGLWVPLVYCVANTVLQGIFCLGLIWRMDPFRMPHTFCTAQAILMHTSWAVIAGVCMAVAVSTSSQVSPKSRGRAYLFARSLFLRLSLVVGFPCIILVAQIVAISELNAAWPTDDMHCDESNPIWVRLLGYAGATLLLAIPSFILSFVTAAQVSRSRTNINSPEVYFSQQDGLTQLPRRRRTRQRSHRSTLSRLLAEEPPLSAPSSKEPLYPSSLTVYAIPSRPDSPSTPFTLGPPGRARVLAGRTRYHLPFDWIEPRYSPSDTQRKTYSKEQGRNTPSESSHLTAPSPIQFASPSKATSTTTVQIAREISRGSSPALSADVEKDSIHLNIYTGFSSDGQFNADKEDTISGSLRWARASEDSSGAKSDLVFAKHDHGEGELETAEVTSEETSLPYESWPRPLPGRISFTRRVLAFQILSSSTQVLAAISTLIDVARRAPFPTPFGTQHVALLLAAWGPCIVFGIYLPSRRRLLR